MKNNFYPLKCLVLLITLSYSQANANLRKWSCQDTLNSARTQVYVDVSGFIDGPRSTTQMKVTVIELDSPISKKELGPFILIPQKANPMSGFKKLAGDPLSFLLFTGEDSLHIFAELEGKLEGKQVVIPLNCRDLSEK